MRKPLADNTPLGVLLMSLAVFLWVVHDAVSKWLLQDYPLFQVLLMRSIFALIPVAVVLYREDSFAQLRSAQAWMLVGRGCLGAISFGLFLAALALMPLADVFAIVMSAPLLIAALSVPLLKEPVGARRWVAVLVGFVAVLFMVRPGGDMSALGALLVVGSVVFYALTMIATRVLGRTATAGTMTFYSALVFLFIGVVVAPFVWINPTPFAMLLMVATGLLAGCAQYSMTEAFRIAPPAVVAPFEYTSMIWAMILGFPGLAGRTYHRGPGERRSHHRQRHLPATS